MLVLFIYFILLASIALIVTGIITSPRLSTRRIPLPTQEGISGQKTAMSPPVQAIFSFTQRLLEKGRLYAKIKNRLDAAHTSLTVPLFFFLKLGLMIMAGLSTLLLLQKLEPAALAIGLGLGYFIPEIWLNRKIAQRRYEIARRLPETVDLLGLCVEAGLDFTTAVKWVIEKKVSSNPMIEELAFVLEEIKWGKPRSQALRDMSKRLNIPEVSSFVQALVQAERMGTPVSEAFGIISEDTRLQRFRRGERYALQAPIKILIPLIFCILPVIAIIVGGPILLQFMQGGLTSGIVK